MWWECFMVLVNSTLIKYNVILTYSVTRVYNFFFFPSDFGTPEAI